MGALRRLQREAFADLLKLRERVEKVEVHSGKTPPSPPHAHMHLSGVNRPFAQASALPMAVGRVWALRVAHVCRVK